MRRTSQQEVRAQEVHRSFLAIPPPSLPSDQGDDNEPFHRERASKRLKTAAAGGVRRSLDDRARGTNK
jgi:hypothetical protein